jgi:hypothetical protein
VEENMSVEDYIIQFVHSGVRPKCVCGKELEFVSNKFRFKIACCNAHVNLGKTHTDEYKIKMKEKVKSIMSLPKHRQRSSENMKKRWESGEIDKLFDIDREKMRQEEQQKIELATEECKECGKFFGKVSQHIRFCSVNSMSYSDYLVKHKYGGIHPKCVCGKETNYRSQNGDFASCCDGHQFLGKVHSDESKKQIYENYSKTIYDRYGVSNGFQVPQFQQKSRETCLQKYGFQYHQQNEDQKKKIPTLDTFSSKEHRKLYNNGQPSREQLMVCDALKATGSFIVEGKEFDMLVDGNKLIEIDSKFHHPPKIEYLTIMQINGVLNDKMKLDIAKRNNYELYRIYTDEIPENITIDTICSASHVPNYDFSYDAPIMAKEYVLSRIEDGKLSDDSKIICKFLKVFCPQIETDPDIIWEFFSGDITFTINKLLSFIQYYKKNGT